MLSLLFFVTNKIEERGELTELKQKYQSGSFNIYYIDDNNVKCHSYVRKPSGTLLYN